MPSRRRFLGQLAVGAALGCGLRSTVLACPKPPANKPALPFETAAAQSSRERFLKWFRVHGVSRSGPIRNLAFNFYDVKKQQASWIYPMLSAKAMLWLIQQGKLGEATAIADTLVNWQQTKNKGKSKLSFGAFPSLLEPSDKGWKMGARFYSGDNLVILEALLSAYEKTKTKEYLNAAIGVGTWLTEVMCQGHTRSLWSQDHGAPMAFVTKNGDFSNEIQTSVEFLWITALHRLGRATSESAYCSQADKAINFYLQGQAAPGPIMDHYNPHYPPKPYSAGHWEQFVGGKMIADNVLRAALGLCKIGELDRAKKVYRWLQVEASGGIPAALNLTTGEALFPEGQDVYYDISSTALHRSLAQWLGDKAAVERDSKLLLDTQDKSGAWYWGALRKNLSPVTPQYAPIVGFWATADLSVPMI